MTPEDIKDVPETEEIEETEVIDDGGEDAATDTEEELEELDENEQKEAKALYKLLKDPSQRNNTLQILAQRAGLLGAETKKEVKENVKALKDLISESLGDEFKFFAPKLTEVIEKVLEQERAQQKVQLSKVEATQTQQEVDSALNRLAAETKGNSRRVESRMIQLMDEIYPSPNISTYQYLKNIYSIASADGAAAATRHSIADKIKRNSKDVAGRLHSSSGRPPGVKDLPTAPAKRGVGAAVQFALEQLEKGQ